MRNRLARLFLLLTVIGWGLMPSAGASSISLAQNESEEGTEVENEGGDQADPGTDTDQGEGAGGDSGEGGGDDPEAETGAGEGEQGAAEGEEGPQWTYQMSRITLVLLLLLLLAMGAMYYRIVGRRQRGV